MCRSGPAATSPSWAASSTTSSQNGREFRDYVVNYTNAPVIINEDFKDTEDLDGFFSGWDEEKGGYDNTTWQYAGMRVRGAVQDEETALSGEAVGYGGHGAGLEHGEPPEEDPTLEHPRCVFQLLKRHYSRYTPERVAEICGCSKEQFLEVAEALCENSGRERTSAFCYAVGWTQHTIGVQIIRTAAIVQLLLGNMGRTGGGIMALRGHASIQGSTDIPTLFNILPGYIPMPHAHAKQTLAEFVEKNASPTGWWGRLDCLHGQPAEGVLRRAGDGRERLLLRLPAPHRRRPLDLPGGAGNARGHGQGLLPVR